MKKIIVLSLMLPLLFSCSSFRTRSFGRNPKPDGITSFYEFSYSLLMRYPEKYYLVERDAEGRVNIAWSEQGEEEIRVILAPEDFLARIHAIVSEHRLHKLRQSYLPRMKVLDGDMWRARIRFDRNSIHTGGSNARPPKELKAGIDAINALIREQIEASTEDDIIDRRKHD